jgi:hypothetical protein
MTLPDGLSQRDLVRLAILLCAGRTDAQHRPPEKGQGTPVDRDTPPR